MSLLDSRLLRGARSIEHRHSDHRSIRTVGSAALVAPIGWLTVLTGLPVALGQPAAGVPNEIHAACEKVIRQSTPLVDAAREYRARRGLWPAKLADLVPEFLSNLPSSGIAYRWDPEGKSTLWLDVALKSGAGRAMHVVHVFAGLDRGWHAGYEGRLRPRYKIEPLVSAVIWIRLGVPNGSAASMAPPASSECTCTEYRPPPSDADIDRALSETARRIEAAPKDPIHHQCRVSLLYNAGRFKPARAAALVWIRAFPRAFAPRYALIDIDRKLLAGLERFESSVEWERKEHASFARWRLFNRATHSSLAVQRLPSAARLPFARDEAEWLIAEMAAYEGAAHSYAVSRYRAAIQVCDAWQAAAETRFEPCDASYFAIRAACHLKLGEFDRAEADLKRLRTPLENGLVWADGIEELRSAIRQRDSEFEYRNTKRAADKYNWLIHPR